MTITPERLAETRKALKRARFNLGLHIIGSTTSGFLAVAGTAYLALGVGSASSNVLHLLFGTALCAYLTAEYRETRGRVRRLTDTLTAAKDEQGGTR